jgi:hypothetical protein
VQIDFKLVGPILLSQKWAEGGVCVVCRTGQTLAVAPIAWEILDFLEIQSVGHRQALIRYLHDKFGVAEVARDELESALDQSLAEFEQLGVIRPVMP